MEENINVLKSLEKEARMIESSVTKLENILVMAEKDHSEVLLFVYTCVVDGGNED